MGANVRYEDFVLKIEALPQGDDLWARVQSSPAGSSRPAKLEIPFPEQDALKILRSLEETIWRSGQREKDPSRHVRPPDALKSTLGPDPGEVGKTLFESLFRGEIRERFLVSLAMVGQREATDLRIRLLIDPKVADQISRWPWELLHRSETRDFLGRGSQTPIVRQVEVDRPRFAPTPLEELRVLAVLSDPREVEPLNVAREKEQLESVLGSVAGIRLRFLEKATIEKLRQRVREEPFDILHFVGHGDLEKSGRGTVIFEDEHGGPDPVPGTVLADTLDSRETSVRLVFLNACETACLPRAENGHDPYTGVAAALIMAGVPAVVANQFPISDRAALCFSNVFYQSLVNGDPLEMAVAEGRKAIFRSLRDSWEWATPVLFLGLPHGLLFSMQRSREAESDLSSEAPQAAESATASEATFEKSLELFERRYYDRARETLAQARENAQDRPKAIYYQCLSKLQGRRPRTARLDVVREIEADLDEAEFLLDQESRDQPAHFWYLRALLKHDFYRFKGLKIQPPTVEETLIEAGVAEADPEELQRLLNHVPTPPSPVREAIERRLAEAGSSSS